MARVTERPEDRNRARVTERPEDRNRATIKRFWSKDCIQTQGDCWEWQAHRNNLGYGMVGIGRKVWLAHRVAIIFTGPDIPEGMVVMHRCDNPACCNPHHLSVGTQLDNVRDFFTKGRLKKAREQRGEQNAMSKLIDSQVTEIRRLASSGMFSQDNLAGMFSISRGLVGLIVSRQVWAHLANVSEEANGLSYQRQILRGEQHPGVKLTEVEVMEIRRRRKAGEPLKTLAEVYGVTQENIYRIAYRKSWRHLPDEAAE